MHSSLTEEAVPATSTLPTLGEDRVLDQHLQTLDGAPRWLLDLKQHSWTRYRQLPLPSRLQENWRYATVDDLDPSAFALPAPVSAAEAAELVERSHRLDEVAARAVFVDDSLVAQEGFSKKLEQQGVIWCSLREAVAKHGDLLGQYFQRQTADMGSEKFQALHTALSGAGMFLYIPRNVVVEAPFVTYHWSRQDGVALLPHTLMVVGENAQATLVNFCESADDKAKVFINTSAAVHAEQNAVARFKEIQNWNRETLAFHLNTATAARDANAKAITVNTGARHLRDEFHSRVQGTGANVELYSLGVPTGEQEYDQRTLQTHEAPGARSDLLYKNALQDDSRTIFSGLIIVEPEGQQTDAYQTNRNLLLSPSAEAVSMPGLEIGANDVKCSHGATTGQLDETNLFYFLARGIPKRKAQELLVFGFLEEIIAKFDNEHLGDYVRELVQRKFLG